MGMLSTFLKREPKPDKLAEIVRLRQEVAALQRAFVVGPGVVEPFERVYGHDQSQFAPTEYGEYITTSNGVYTCATLRAKLLSSLPIKLYKVNGANNKTEVTRGPLYDLLRGVNPHWTIQRLIYMSELCLCLWGSSAWFLERGQTGRQPPKEIWWARSDKVKVRPDPVDYIVGYLYDANGVLLPFEPQETIWIALPNPLDEFSGLSPIAAARLAADYARSGMQSNMRWFDQGMQLGGVITPPDGMTLEGDTARELEAGFQRRFAGRDRAHRWAVLRAHYKVTPLEAATARDAQFLEGLTFSLEEICRAYGVPLDLIGGQRTYENADAAYRGMWINTVLPQATFIAAELTEKLLPLFPGQADVLEFDASGVEVLQDNENDDWTRAGDQMTKGALTINEWRESRGQPKVPWGNVNIPAAHIEGVNTLITAGFEPSAVLKMYGLPDLPIAVKPAPVAPPPVITTIENEAGQDEPPALPPPERRQRATRAIAYGGEEHTRLYQRHVRRAERHEERIGDKTAELMRRQQTSVLARLQGRNARTIDEVAANPFDLAQWVKTFRVEIRPILTDIVQATGIDALDNLGAAVSNIDFAMDAPEVVRFLEQRAQRFAKEVNQTTWDQLRAALLEGLAVGDDGAAMAARVEHVMGNRIRSSGEVIARTETIGAMSGGSLEAWRQSGVVAGKEWVAALDDRTRTTHRRAHGQTVPLDGAFKVGQAEGPGPGLMGLAEEDCNERCTMIAVLD